jgi:hypothetical protein
MNFCRFVKHHAGTPALACAILAGVSSVHADTILPATNFACTPVNSCSGSATQLPLVNGIQGVEFNVAGSSSGSDSAEFVFSTTGLLSGSDIPSGAVIPYSFSFLADSTSPSGTMVDNAAFHPDSNMFFINNEQSTIVSDGFCSPSGNVHWCRTVQGTGTMTFTSGVLSGSSLELSADFLINAHSNLGTPTIGLRGQIDFNPIPEPRNTSLVLLLAAAVVAGLRAVRTPPRPGMI